MISDILREHVTTRCRLCSLVTLNSPQCGTVLNECRTDRALHWRGALLRDAAYRFSWKGGGPGLARRRQDLRGYCALLWL